MHIISNEEFVKVTYLDTTALHGRVVALMALWDGKRWHQWVPSPEGLIEVEIVDTVEAPYVARERAHDSDLLIPFIDFMWQRASYARAAPLIAAITEDFHNMGTSIAKLHHFHRTQDAIQNSNAPRFAATELEYLVILTRSVFDLLQETIKNIWGHVELIDREAETRRRQRMLPDTFSKLVLRDKAVLKSPEEIMDRYALPQPIAVEYAKQAAFFSELRDFRDMIVHGSSEIGYIYATNKGFCVDPTTRPFSSFAGWSEEHRYNENLVSILPWIANIVVQTIDACNALISSFASAIRFPPEIAPGLHVFLCGPSTDALSAVLAIQKGGSPWWNSNQDDEST